MKVLVVCVPGPGHVNPLLPLVEAFRAGGDRVVVAAGDDPGGVVTRSGAEFRRAGHSEMDWFGVLDSRTRGSPGDGLAPERINHYFYPRLFGEVAATDMIDDVLACGRDLEPDVVVFETYALAGPLAADLLGVPGVHHHISPMLPHEVLQLADDAVSPLWRSFGRDTPGYAGAYRGVTIEVTPPSLERQQIPSGESLALRPVRLPLLPLTPSTPPVVYVTLGTFFGANADVFRAVLDGLAEEPVEMVVTVGADQDPARLGPTPKNAQVERFVPQADLLPACSAVVHHGGSGTLFGSLAHALPQVVVPQGADNFVNAHLLARSGAGRTLRPGEVAPESVRQALRLVLDDESYRDAARLIAGEIGVMPGPHDVAQTLRERFSGGPVDR